MRTPHVGLFLGAILGFALIVEGFGEMLIVALFAALGWLVASVLSGTIDVGEVLSIQRDRSAGRRDERRRRGAGPSPADGAASAAIEPRRRGRLIVSDRAARHLIQGVAERGPLRTRDVDVHIDHLDDNGVSARLEFAAEYPESALSVALERFRQHVGEEVRRLLGRPLRRLDVVVSDLVVDIEPGRRVR